MTLTASIWRKSDGTLTPLYFLHTLDQDLDPSVNFLGPNVCSQPIELLDFGVYLVLDTTSFMVFSVTYCLELRNAIVISILEFNVY